MIQPRFALPGAAALAVAALLAGASVAPAQAIELIAGERLAVDISLEAGTAYLHTEDTNFGAGRFDLETGAATGDAQWVEGYVEPGLAFSYASERAGVVYGGASAVTTITRGDGDAGGFTSGDEEDLAPESLFAGWRSGTLLAEQLGEDAVDLSFGAQDVRVGDGFLVWDGDFDSGDDGAYWLAPRSAFDLAAVAKLATTPVGGQAFWLRSDSDQGNTELLGLDLTHDPGFGTLGATYLQILDADAAFDVETPRDGMQTLSLRAEALHAPAFEDLTLYSEIAHQFGDGPNADFDALGFHVEPAYSFSTLPWTPTIAYRFAYFSGDPDPDDAERADFDPLFYDFSRDWGTWTQGEITGNYLLFNSNQINHMLHLAAYPSESVGFGLLYFRFALEEDNYYGEPVSDRHFADEVNLYLDWALGEHLAVGAVYGAAWPETAAEEVFGEDDTFHLFEVYAIVSF